MLQGIYLWGYMFPELVLITCIDPWGRSHSHYWCYKEGKHLHRNSTRVGLEFRLGIENPNRNLIQIITGQQHSKQLSTGKRIMWIATPTEGDHRTIVRPTVWMRAKDLSTPNPFQRERESFSPLKCPSLKTPCPISCILTSLSPAS